MLELAQAGLAALIDTVIVGVLAYCVIRNSIATREAALAAFCVAAGFTGGRYFLADLLAGPPYHSAAGAAGGVAGLIALGAAGRRMRIGPARS
ncbi:MAG: hypothetical protein RIQ99_984 [Pseudomonadota bacterium]|jgi:hypothetical protein